MGNSLKEWLGVDKSEECPYLQDGGYVSCSIETHEVERELLELVGPVTILLQMMLQVQSG